MSNHGSELLCFILTVVTVKFTEEEFTVNEEGGPVEVCVEKDSGIAESFTVSLPTQDGSAEGEWSTSAVLWQTLYIHLLFNLYSVAGPDLDYDGTALSVEFTPGGPDMACVDIPIVDDNLSEGTEDFTVDLEPLNPDVQVGDPSTATVIIIDDESMCIVPTFTKIGFCRLGMNIDLNPASCTALVVLFVEYSDYRQMIVASSYLVLGVRVSLLN